MPLSPKKILVTRTDRIGDFMLSTPVFEALREKYPYAKLSGLTFVENRELIEGNPYLDEVLLYDKKGRERGWWGNFLFAWKLAERHFDLVIHLHATNRMHLVTWLAGIPVRIGWARKSSWALTHAYRDIKRQGEKHEAAYNFELLKELGVLCPEHFHLYFPVKEKHWASARMLLTHLGVSLKRPYVVLSPSASCPSKRWPPRYFAKLMEELRVKTQAEILVIGSLQDRLIADKIREFTQVSFWDLTGRLSLGMLGQILKHAALLISCDSGPVHIASAVATPVISIFGRNQPGLSPKRWGPVGDRSKILWKDIGCQNCLAHNCEIGFLCLEAVTVSEVMTAVLEFQPQLFKETVSV